MNSILNTINLDLIIGLFLILMLVYGYFRGFVYSIYGLIATIVALLLALFISSPLALLIKVYQATGIYEPMGAIINRILIFVILLFVFKIILALIGRIIIPLIKGVIDRIGLFRWVDGILGAGFKVIESLIFIYLSLVLIITPLVPGGYDLVSESYGANLILKLVPSLTQEINELNSSFELLNDAINQGLSDDGYNSFSMETIIRSLAVAKEYDLIKQEEIVDILYRYFDPVSEPITVNNELYQTILALTNQFDEATFDQNRVLSKIVVGE